MKIELIDYSSSSLILKVTNDKLGSTRVKVYSINPFRFTILDSSSDELINSIDSELPSLITSNPDESVLNAALSNINIDISDSDKCTNSIGWYYEIISPRDLVYLMKVLSPDGLDYGHFIISLGKLELKVIVHDNPLRKVDLLSSSYSSGQGDQCMAWLLKCVNKLVSRLIN